MCAAKDVFGKLGNNQRPRLFTSRQGKGLQAQRGFFRKQADSVFPPVIIDGRSEVGMQLSAFRQFPEDIRPIAPGGHAVQFLNSNDIRTGIVDHIGYALVVAAIVHASGIADVVGHQPQDIPGLGRQHKECRE